MQRRFKINNKIKSFFRMRETEVNRIIDLVLKRNIESKNITFMKIITTKIQSKT